MAETNDWDPHHLLMCFWKPRFFFGLSFSLTCSLFDINKKSLPETGRLGGFEWRRGSYLSTEAKGVPVNN